MSREPKPYYRKAQKRWVCTINGVRITLGENREESLAEFHRLMTERENINAKLSTLYDLSQLYLTWVQENRKSATYNLQKHYLQSFIEHVGRRMKIDALKRHHLTKWTNRDTWNSTTRNDAISTVQRMINWAIEEGYITKSPIPRIKKPARKRREVCYTPEQWALIKSHVTDDCFSSFLDFLWITGCRPKEARDLEAKHIHDDLVIFPPDESKGERDARVIVMTPEAKAIVKPLAEKYPTGALFRNSRGDAWRKDAVKDRLRRISDKVGFRCFAYATRHSFATNGLIRSVDANALAGLMGHRNSRMIATVYSHVAKDIDFLRKQAIAASGVQSSGGD